MALRNVFPWIKLLLKVDRSIGLLGARYRLHTPVLFECVTQIWEALTILCLSLAMRSRLLREVSVWTGRVSYYGGWFQEFIVRNSLPSTELFEHFVVLLVLGVVTTQNFTYDVLFIGACHAKERVDILPVILLVLVIIFWNVSIHVILDSIWICLRHFLIKFGETLAFRNCFVDLLG